MDDGQTTKAKMSGYLHMKIKKRMMSSWKNYWFVLEDRLLLYYRSKVEYEAISPCKGSINLGPPCAVKSLPSVTNGFQIATRTVTYTLKADNPEDQKKWMQIILSVLNQNQNFPSEGAKRLSHFRYSLDDLIPEVEPNDPRVLPKTNFERQNTLPNRSSYKPKSNDEIIGRLQKIGYSYGGSLEAISKIASKKMLSPTLSVDGARGSRNGKEEEEIIRHRRVCGENIYERISGDYRDSNTVSLLVDNENYSVPVRKSVSVVERERPPLAETRETKSLLVENDQYGVTRQAQSDEVIYAEPKINERTDFNKNSVIVENSFYTSTEVINRSNPSENLYEDLDHHYSRPIFKSFEESSSHSSVESNKKDEQKLKKTKSFIRRVWRKKKKIQKTKSEEEDLYAEIDTTAAEKVAITDENTMHMLSELHSILEKQKTKMKANKSKEEKDVKTEKPSATTTESVCPSLPPKTHTAPKQPVEQVRSLDEILEDLDKEKIESKSKVQMLIEKFEPEGDVILRKHDKIESFRHSDELNKLLNELAKVTSAPVMTPGVTSSLVNPHLTDEEWLKLLPVRQRRLSEPDYDVPRVHKSIQIPVCTESDAIPATRFFGPVLPSSDNKEELSMTPDSLEVDQQPTFETQYSYTSHNYHNQFSQNYQDDKVIYALPKSYVSVATHIVNTCQNICGAHMTDESTVIYKSVKKVEVQEEIFNDSLELCNETLTEF